MGYEKPCSLLNFIFFFFFFKYSYLCWLPETPFTFLWPLESASPYSGLLAGLLFERNTDIFLSSSELRSFLNPWICYSLAYHWQLILKYLAGPVNTRARNLGSYLELLSFWMQPQLFVNSGKEDQEPHTLAQSEENRGNFWENSGHGSLAQPSRNSQTWWHHEAPSENFILILKVLFLMHHR